MKKFKCTQTGCHKEYNDAAHLGIHLRSAHGILGQSANAVKRRRLKQAAAALPQPVPVVESTEAAASTAKPKRKYAKRRSLDRAQQTLAIAETGAGENLRNHEAHPASDSIPEAALALALGRFQELCRSIAFELDLPARMFTERVAAFVYAAQIRQPSRSAVRVPPLR